MGDDSFMRGIIFCIGFCMGNRSFYHIKGWEFAQCQSPYGAKRQLLRIMIRLHRRLLCMEKQPMPSCEQKKTTVRMSSKGIACSDLSG
ncbi:hypothetical protein D3C78_587860 [compost metagenome]